MRQAIVDRQAQMEHMLHVVGSERVQNVEQMLMSPPVRQQAVGGLICLLA